MHSFKLFIVLALALLLTVPAGLAYAQEEPVATTVTAVISDSNDGKAATINDVVTFAMTGVTPPAANKALEGWLVSDDGSKKLSTGVITVLADGSASHTYTSPTGENLFKTYDKVLITEEPVPDADPGPSAVVLFSHQIPAGAMVHVRHLLVSYPPGAAKGIMTDLKEQLDIAIVHGFLAKAAADASSLADVQLHAHHIINIIEGKRGANYHAASGNPGDDIGVLAHAKDGRVHCGLAQKAAPDDAVIAARQPLCDASGKGAEDWSILARDKALALLKEGNLTLAKLLIGPGVDSIISQLEAARNGFDADGDGTVASTAGEGGAAQAYLESQLLATHTLVGRAALPGAPGKGPTIGLPKAGDTSVPALVPVALIASLLFLGAGGFLLWRGRRSRTNG